MTTPTLRLRGPTSPREYLERIAKKKTTWNLVLASQMLGALWLGEASMEFLFGFWEPECVPIPHVRRRFEGMVGGFHDEWKVRIRFAANVWSHIEATLGKRIPDPTGTDVSNISYFLFGAKTFDEQALRVNVPLVFRRLLPKIRQRYYDLCGYDAFDKDYEDLLDALRVLPDHWARSLWNIRPAFTSAITNMNLSQIWEYMYGEDLSPQQITWNRIEAARLAGVIK